MSRKIKINYKNLNSNLKKITYHFFTDWIIEMLPVELMKFVLNHCNCSGIKKIEDNF